MTLAPFLDVSDIARDLTMSPADLVRELLSDGVNVLPISTRRYRVEAAEYAAWRAKRATRLATQHQQSQRRADFVADGAPAKRKPKFK